LVPLSETVYRKATGCRGGGEVSREGIFMPPELLALAENYFVVVFDGNTF